MQKTYTLSTLSEIDTITASILDDFKDYKVFTLTGDLGAGKTTLTQAFCKILKVEDEVVSPTYTIVNEYKTSDKKQVYHADLYRLENSLEAINVGIEDYLYSNCYCFIEWPKIIEDILPYKFVNLDITNSTDEHSASRTIIATAYGGPA